MTSTVTITQPRFEHLSAAATTIGVGTATPRISWASSGVAPGAVQTAYEIEIARGGERSNYVVRVASQVLVPWPGPPLRSREGAEVRVRVEHEGQWSAWSPAASIEAGLLAEGDWTAQFVSPVGIAGLDSCAPVLVGRISIEAPITRARLFATAHGIYVPSINGVRVDDTVLAPGWTAYDARLRYHAYDVTELLHEGENELSALLGNGWYRGYLSYMGERALYGDRLALCAQLEITTNDGLTHVLGTDASWSAFESGVLTDDLYNGQTTDLRRDWRDERPAAVEVVDSATSRLVAAEGPPMRPTGAHGASRVWTSPAGRTLVDFGQNAVGWVRLRVRNPSAGTEVVIRHAEVLEGGELGTRPLRSAEATDRYVLAGAAEATLQPSLTLHGFRYAEVTGVPGLDAADIEQVVVGTDLERTGWFESSHSLLNKLHDNVVWSTRSNFVDIPTDCPQRNERLGWTGDIQVFAPTALFLYNAAGLLSSWLEDLAAEQYAHGGVPHVIPNTNRTRRDDPEAAAWGDAATIVPWTLYQQTGDSEVLRRQLPSMRAWVDRVAELAGDDLLWKGGFQFGDWLDPTAPPERPGEAKAATEVVATAHFARSAQILADASRVVGEAALAETYGDLAARVRGAFADAYVSKAGRIVSEAQTTYALALEWDLIPSAMQRDEAGRRLADLVRTSGFRIATGFVGTPLICDALTHAGYADLAYRLLFQTACPSWLYPVTMGATTIWERWDSMLPDGSINPGEMTSFNHYALGAVADWLHRAVAGLEPLAPGYRRVRIAPIPPRKLAYASARHVSPFGEISVGWRREGDDIVVNATLPPGVDAEVELPGSDRAVHAGHGTHEWRTRDPFARVDTGRPLDTIRDLVDDEATWSAVVAATTEVGLTPLGELEALELVAAHLDQPAHMATGFMSDAGNGSPTRVPAAHPVHATVAALISRPIVGATRGLAPAT